MNPASIVCPIEFSGPDRTALAQALQLARSYDAELHVLHVGRGRRRTTIANIDAGGHPLEGRLREFVDSAQADGVTLTTALLWGDPLGAVADYVRRHGADLVVVAQHGRRGSAYWPAGAFAKALGRAVDCPTIAVPVGAPSSDAERDGVFRNILCAIDFSEASLGGLGKALTFARQSAGRVTLLHVLEGFPAETVRFGRRAVSLVGEYRTLVARANTELRLLVPSDALNWCDAEYQVVSGLAQEAIPAAAAACAADLIVVGLPRGRRLLGLATGTTAKGVLRRTPCPVLIVPGPAASATARDRSEIERAVYSSHAPTAAAHVPSASVAQSRARA